MPLIVVSPYAKAAYISHVTHDFGSILKFIETSSNCPRSATPTLQPTIYPIASTSLNRLSPLSKFPTALSAAFFINDKRQPTAPDDD